VLCRLIYFLLKASCPSIDFAARSWIEQVLFRCALPSSPARVLFWSAAHVCFDLELCCCCVIPRGAVWARGSVLHQGHREFLAGLCCCRFFFVPKSLCLPAEPCSDFPSAGSIAFFLLYFGLTSGASRPVFSSQCRSPCETKIDSLFFVPAVRLFLSLLASSSALRCLPFSQDCLTVKLVSLLSHWIKRLGFLVRIAFLR
jgi:hypothetical protein